MRKHFTIDNYSHYVFTPRDLTSWVLGLMRYPLASSLQGGGVPGAPTQGVLLEMWAYEACRLFRDRLVGHKAQEQFDAILSSVVLSNWSFDLSTLEREGGSMYVTWGSTQTGKCVFGRSLGRLSISDMEGVVAKGVVAYGKSIVSVAAKCISLKLASKCTESMRQNRTTEAKKPRSIVLGNCTSLHFSYVC